MYEIELRERMVRVEEELKHQRELMREGFALMDKRFEAMQANMDQRFESVQQDIRNLQQRMDSFMRWSFGITIGVGGVIIGVLKLWP